MAKKAVPKVYHWLDRKYHRVTEIEHNGRDLIVSRWKTSTGWEYEIQDRCVILLRIRLGKEGY